MEMTQLEKKRRENEPIVEKLTKQSLTEKILEFISKMGEYIPPEYEYA